MCVGCEAQINHSSFFDYLRKSNRSARGQLESNREHSRPRPRCRTMSAEVVITSIAQLRQRMGHPKARVANKVGDKLGPIHRQWIKAAPLCFVATSDAEGRCDVSPKGDPSAVAHVLDEKTLVLPERPGNRRADGFLNVLQNPHAGLLFIVPGRGDTLRVNGRATILEDAPYFDALIVQGHRPAFALRLEVEEVFFHCAKAFLRSKSWEPESWNQTPLPSRAQIAQTLERPNESIEALEAYYGPKYREGLYRER